MVRGGLAPASCIKRKPLCRKVGRLCCVGGASFARGAFAGRLSAVLGWIGREFPPAGFAHPAGYGGAEQCSAKPRLRPRRATFFLASPRKEAKKATRLPGHSLTRMTPLRCSRQAAGAELALRAQTAAPDYPACRSAARRVGTGFCQAPSLCGKTGEWRRWGFAFALIIAPCFSKRAVFAKSPF